MKKLILFIITSILAITASANTQQELKKTVVQWQSRFGIPAVSLYIKTPDNTYQILHGKTRLIKGHPIDENTMFGVGSITKTFASVIMLKLEAQGKVKLADTVGQFLPEYPNWKDITIKQLLNMTSGIPNATEDKTVAYDMNMSIAPDYTSKKLTDIAYKLPMKFKPGDSWYYSNTNYFLIGMIIENVTGQKLNQVVNEMIIKPYNLEHTLFSNTTYSEKLWEQMAHGYYNFTDKIMVQPSNYGIAGSAFMNATDIAKWVNDLLVEKTVLPEEQLKQMLTFVKVPENNIRPKNTFYGLGIYMTKSNQYGEIIWYTGVIDGYSSVFMWIPKEKTILTAQINSWNGDNFNLLFPNQHFVQKVLSEVLVY